MSSDDVANPPPNLPPYPEMILAAIAELNESGGSNKSAISRQIEASHKGALSESYWSLLMAHLDKLKESGELIFSKNNYLRPGDVPPKRGRGRPPKPKTDLPPGTAASPRTPGSGRPRGRPAKPKDPVAVAAAQASSGLPKRRGRPPKAAGASRPKPPARPGSVPAAAAGTPAVTGVKRGRGRPPKGKPALSADAATLISKYRSLFDDATNAQLCSAVEFIFCNCPNKMSSKIIAAQIREVRIRLMDVKKAKEEESNTLLSAHCHIGTLKSQWSTIMSLRNQPRHHGMSPLNDHHGS